MQIIANQRNKERDNKNIGLQLLEGRIYVEKKNNQLNKFFVKDEREEDQSKKLRMFHTFNYLNENKDVNGINFVLNNHGNHSIRMYRKKIKTNYKYLQFLVVQKKTSSIFAEHLLTNCQTFVRKFVTNSLLVVNFL